MQPSPPDPTVYANVFEAATLFASVIGLLAASAANAWLTVRLVRARQAILELKAGNARLTTQVLEAQAVVVRHAQRDDPMRPRQTSISTESRRWPAADPTLPSVESIGWGDHLDRTARRAPGPPHAQRIRSEQEALLPPSRRASEGEPPPLPEPGSPSGEPDARETPAWPPPRSDSPKR